jgi:hypothetical protein
MIRPDVSNWRRRAVRVRSRAGEGRPSQRFPAPTPPPPGKAGAGRRYGAAQRGRLLLLEDFRKCRGDRLPASFHHRVADLERRRRPGHPRGARRRGSRPRPRAAKRPAGSRSGARMSGQEPRGRSDPLATRAMDRARLPELERVHRLYLGDRRAFVRDPVVRQRELVSNRPVQDPREFGRVGEVT